MFFSLMMMIRKNLKIGLEYVPHDPNKNTNPFPTNYLQCIQFGYYATYKFRLSVTRLF